MVLLMAAIFLLPTVWHIRNRPPSEGESPKTPSSNRLIAPFTLHASLGESGDFSVTSATERISLPFISVAIDEISAYGRLASIAPNEGTGTLSAASVSIGTLKLGRQEASLLFNGDRTQIKAECNLAPWLNTTAAISGSITNLNNPSGKITAIIPAGREGAPLFLPVLNRNLKGAESEGTLRAELFLAGNTPASSASIKAYAKDLTIRLPEAGLTLSNINAHCEWKLPQFPQSNAHAEMNIEYIKWSNLSVSNVTVNFQLLHDGEIFIEQVLGEWCGGKLKLFAISITPDALPERIQIYARNLQLDSLLRECGLAGVTAIGRLDGQLPLRIKNKRINIENGLLGTPPGEKGTLRIGSSTTLDQALGATRSAELQLAREALRNFNYDWARISIATLEGALNIKAAVHGISSAPLPFMRDRWGKILNSNSRKDKWLHEPMTLELNFHIPLPVIFE